MKKRHYIVKKMPYRSLIREHENIVRVLSKSKSPSMRRLYREQKKELKEYKEEYRRKRRK